MEMGNMTQAVQQFYRTIKEMPRHVKSHFQLARAFATQDNLSKTEEILIKTLELNPRFVPAYIELGKTAERQFQLDKATTYYEKAVEIDESCKEAYLQLGLINKTLGKLDLSIKFLTKAIELDPTEADALYSFGLIHLQRNQYDKAVDKFLQTIKLQPLHLYAHYSLGLSYHKLGKIEKAIDEYIKSLKLNPRDAQAHSALGEAYSEKGEFENSLQCYRYALEINPRDIAAQYHIGNIYMKMDAYEKAAEAFRSAAEMDNSRNFRNYFSAVNLMERGIIDDAITSLESATANMTPQEQDFASFSCISYVALSAVKQAKEKTGIKNLSDVLNSSLDSIITVIADAADNRFDDKEGHSKRVGEMAYMLATNLGVDDENSTLVRYAAILHDIGKLYIPESVLNANPGEISAEERDMLRDHPQYSYEMIKEIALLEDCAEAALYHHERHDGQGFPEGLTGEEIPLGAQIIGIVNYWDNLVKQKDFTPAQAIDNILKLKDKKFSPEITDAFLAIVDRLILI
jgi:putative nucleotidyltransferase with HDIG domain